MALQMVSNGLMVHVYIYIYTACLSPVLLGYWGSLSLTGKRLSPVLQSEALLSSYFVSPPVSAVLLPQCT